MKITLNKRDYATIVRNCMKAREGYDGCGKCALAGVCSGPEELEASCILEDSETTERYDLDLSMV